MKVRISILCLMTVAFVLAGGCAMPRVQEPLTRSVGGTDAAAQAEFWYQLSERQLACNDEAFHALLLFVEAKEPPDDYAGRVAELKKRQMLPAGFNRPADEGIDRGTFAVAVVRALSIKGGLMLTVLGPTPRYATRELQSLSLYPPSSPGQGFSGTDLVAIVGRMEDYQRGNSANAPATVLPGEMSRAPATSGARE